MFTFNNISTRKKLLFFPTLFIFIVISSATIYKYFSDYAIERTNIAIITEELVQSNLKGRISVYQFLRTPTEQNQKLVLSNFNNLIVDISKLKDSLVSQENQKICDNIINHTKDYIELFKSFSQDKIVNSLNQEPETNNILQKIAQMVKIGLNLEEEIMQINQSSIKLRDSAYSSLNTDLLILSVVAITIFILFSILISNSIINSIESFKEGLLKFFSYLNRESKEINLINISSKDEFGEMSKVVNENILKTQKGIEEDRILIDETIAVLSEFEQGDLCQRLNLSVKNPALMELKSILNKMADNLENNIDSVLNILEKYSNYNYLDKIPTYNLKQHLLKLSNGVNTLGDSITQMLIDNKTNGLTLKNSADLLLVNVDTLNISSNEAATSLEETAAALEEITSNIRNNTENIQKMAILSHNVTTSANQGETLANQTSLAMDDINIQVNLIKEAIGIIDNIAFQTNILSLNAAVEAATAGEAGKGFAVVAGEVRNLASRSAEAAKEIKDIVELATKKANEGKNIASNMIIGYKELNLNISETMDLIDDIQNASKEQLTGIEQINDAVNRLDSQTQNNAMVASQAHNVATSTGEISKIIVEYADKNEFIGKDLITFENGGGI
ncbi:MCP-domain signal transduction protein [Aliarcobacter faecis]|uniref:methyl-accepting chemotaxis protein n=1 Tax=Aliarcobacter faecis TaxID=1564138 RepID=UPI0004AF8A17|nr:methyl-accepting chemotaxis protein [Aliarcobacter faecis]QKF72262.1 MCP-domain signal transduction protein [Aliarcobacter faecis]